MPQPTSLARARYQRSLRRTVRTIARSPNRSAPGTLRANSGALATRDHEEAERGSYTLTMAATASLVFQPGEEVEIVEESGRIFRVVWTPPVGDVSRRYGLEEVR